MPVEIERKFLVDSLPSPEVLGVADHLRQGYLAEEGGVSLRLRVTDSAATLTVKVGSGLERTEVEVAIGGDEAEALWPHTVGRRVEKWRHRLALEGADALVAEVDRYGGDLEGLLTVEVEFADAREAADFPPPAWFGTEVTGDERWSNAALARHGRPADPAGS